MDGMVRRVACVAALLACGACATPAITASTSEVAARLAFLHAGQTQIREVIDRLGEPSFRHEADHTMIWISPDALVASVAPQARSRCELVLQFDATGTYVRGSVVRAE